MRRYAVVIRHLQQVIIIQTNEYFRRQNDEMVTTSNTNRVTNSGTGTAQAHNAHGFIITLSVIEVGSQQKGILFVLSN
jgi:hypothetical protein